MAKFNFCYNEISENRVWFEAKNLNHAKELLNEVMDEQLNIVDLPKWEEKNRAIWFDFDVTVLEEEGAEQSAEPEPKGEKTLHYFAADGSFGEANGLEVIDTTKWTDFDWENLEETPEESRAATAKIINNKYKK